MNDQKIQAIKGMDNPIEIQILNSDRRPVKLLGKAVKAVLSKVSNNDVYLNKSMDLVDADKAIFKTTLTVEELQDTPTGLAQLAFYVQDSSGRNTPLLKNTAGKYAVDINVIDGPYVIPMDDNSDDNGSVTVTTDGIDDYGSITDPAEILEDAGGNQL
jgi:hypothetical protein